MISSAFKDRTLMITGGTGSFGSTVLKHFLESEIGEIRIFSRDEKKQDDMRHRLQLENPEFAGKVRFHIGDVRDSQSVRDAMRGVDYIFHAAALKQVPSCEFFPMEAVKTNVVGTDNVLHAAIAEGVERVVCLSTDKAAYPINAMGKSKAMMESIIYANARNGAGRTTICCTRYGNVMCSRGSVIPLFIDRIKKDVSIWNINSFAEYYMQIFEKYRSYYKNGMERFYKVRRQFVEQLKNLPGLRVIPSQANYVMCEVIHPCGSALLTEQLLTKYNILIKDLSSKKGFSGRPYVRIAVKRPEENEAIVTALKEILQ